MGLLHRKALVKLFIVTAILVVGGYFMVYMVSLRDLNKAKKEASAENQRLKNAIGIELDNLKEGLQNGSQLGNSSIDYSKLNSSSLTSNLNNNFVSLQQGTSSPQTGGLSVTGSIQTPGTVQGSQVNADSLNVGNLNGVLKADEGTVSGSATTSDVPEGTKLYYTDDRVDQNIASKTTDNLTEGTTNQYYTDTRARNSISAVSPISYDNVAGVFSLDNSGVTTGTYGDGTHVGQFTVDEKGRVTSVADVLITGAAPVGPAGGDLTGNFPNPTIKNTWTGVTGITTLGTITTGTWNAGSITSSGAIQGTSLNVGAGAISGGTVNGATISGGTLSGGNVSGGTLTATAVNGVTTADIIVSTGSYADPSWLTSLAKSKVSLGSVENTALSTWNGTSNITTLGTITTGTWNAGSITSSGAIQGTSLTATGLTLGSIPFIGTGGTFSQDNSNLFWDNTNKRLGIGTASPSQALTINTGGKLRFNSSGAIDMSGGGSIGGSGDITINPSSGNILLNPASGNVGIGTTSPGTNLHISKSVAGISNFLTLENSYSNTSINEGTGIYFKGYFKQALISAFQNPVSTTGGDLQLQTYSDNNTLNTGIYLNRLGNVGIGTTSPTSLLDVGGASSFAWGGANIKGGLRVWDVGASSSYGLRLSADNTNGFAYIEGYRETVGAINLVLQKDGGNVGIGTTSPSYKLHISGSSPTLYIQGSDENGERIYFAHGGGSPDSSISHNSAFGGGLEFRTGGVSSSSTTRLAITASGKVGIGTTSPGQLLDIQGGASDTRINVKSTGSHAAIQLDSAVGSNALFKFMAAGIQTGLINVDGSDSNKLKLGTTATAMTIDTSGKVGIGTTSPGATLEVNGSAQIDGALTVNLGVNNNFQMNTVNNSGSINLTSGILGSQSWYLYRSDTIASGDYTNSTKGNYFINTATGKNLYLGSNGGIQQLNLVNGNVGIGTTSPSTLLHTKSSTDGTQLTLEKGVSTAVDMIFKNTVQQWKLGMNATEDFILADVTAGTQPLTVLESSGNVGIGTASPGYKLDVKGTTTADVINTDIGLNLNNVTKPSSGSVALINSPGNVDAGTHYYWVTYKTAIGETGAYAIGNVTTDASNGQVTVTIPVSTDYRVTGRKIYRTKVGGSSWSDYLLTTINDNTSVTYVDNVADSALTGTMSAGYYQTNTTNKGITLNDAIVMKIDPQATYFGVGAGLNVSGGGNNSLFGYNAGLSISTGNQNSFFGTSAGLSVTTGGNNVAMGQSAGQAVTTGNYNIMIGRNAGISANSSSSNNTIIGAMSFNLATPGVSHYNTAFGSGTGSYNNGNANIFLGYYAGHYETGSSTLIIDNLDRSTEALGRTSALIYGVTNSTATSQILALGGGGKVGIGTTSPNAKLDVSGDIGIQLSGAGTSAKLKGLNGASEITSIDMGNGSSRSMALASQADISFDTDSDNNNTGINFKFTTNGGVNELMRIQDNGNVGIGTTSPGAKLQINTGATGTIGQIIKAYSGQTADLLQAQDSTGAVLAKIDASGNLTVQSATFNGTLTVNGHIITANTSGSTTIAAGANAGTGASVSITGNDTSGTITVTTGAGSTAGVLATVTFASAYGVAPNVVLTPKGNSAATIQYNYGSATTNFTLNSANAPVDSTTYTYSYMIMQ